MSRKFLVRYMGPACTLHSLELASKLEGTLVQIVAYALVLTVIEGGAVG